MIFPWFSVVWTLSTIWDYLCRCFSWVVESRSMSLGAMGAVPQGGAVMCQGKELWLGAEGEGPPPGAQPSPLPLAFLALAEQVARPGARVPNSGVQGPQALSAAPRLPALPTLQPGDPGLEPHERAGSWVQFEACLQRAAALGTWVSVTGSKT